MDQRAIKAQGATTKAVSELVTNTPVSNN